MNTTDELPRPTDADRIAQLERTVADLASQLTETQRELSRRRATAATEYDETAEPAREPSRRNLFRLAAGAAAAGGAVALAGARPAAAADGDPVTVGASTTQGDFSGSTTVIDYANGSGPQVGMGLNTASANIFLARDRPGGLIPISGPDASSFPAAVAGYAHIAVENGVYGFSSVTNGNGVVASGGASSTGLLARGGRSNVRLENAGDAPTARSDAHLRGELIADSTGRLWYCTADGTPGTWQVLATAGANGAFTAIASARTFDSRFSTAIQTGTNRTASIKDQIDVDTGAVSTADLVPAGATAITANITITRTTGVGFVAINPGGDTVIKASTINWTADNVTVANAGVFALGGDRQLQVLAGGPPGGSAQVIVDVTGYYL